LPDALLLVNCNGTVVNANTIALEAFEAPGTALVGRGLLDLLPQFDSKRIPGSMRTPDEAAAQVNERQRPTRMVARRTDGSEFPVEVTSANLEDGRTPYASAIDAAFADPPPGYGGTGGPTGGPGGPGYTGDELLMLVVRDLTGTLDTEAELARQQRQTEMILRAASEGVIGVDTEARIVLVNPAAAQILGHRASDLGGKELHPLLHHSRADGTPLAFGETPLSDTLKSGRKHRVKIGQVLWAKDGRAVPVDMTTAPVRDGDQLVGAVLTFTDRRAYEALAGRNEQLTAVLGDALRAPLDRMRGELTGLAEDPAGQLWPEANQILHHLAAGYGRMMALVDNVLGYQQLDSGRVKLRRERVPLDGVVSAGVDGAVELIGPGRAQFAVHAPPIEAEVDPERLATALAHLVADVAGVDATGGAPAVAPAGVDSTIVVAAAQRGDVVRIEVRGPYGGGSPVHQPIVRGIVRKHGGVLQTHEVPGGGSAFVLEVPVSAGGAGASAAGAAATGEASAGADSTGGGRSSGAHAAVGTGAGHGAPPRPRESRENETTVMPVPAQPVRGGDGADAGAGPEVGAWTGDGTHASGAGSPNGALDTGGSPIVFPAAAPADPAGAGEQTGGRGVHAAQPVPDDGQVQAQAQAQAVRTQPAEQPDGRPTGRRRGRPSPGEEQQPGQQGRQEQQPGQGVQPDAAGQLAQGGALELPPAGSDSGAATVPRQQGAGRRARRALGSPSHGLGDSAEVEIPRQEADGAEASGAGAVAVEPQPGPGTGRRARRPAQEDAGQVSPPAADGEPVGPSSTPAAGTGGGRRARRLARQAEAEARAAQAQPGQPGQASGAQPEPGQLDTAQADGPVPGAGAQPAQQAQPAQHAQPGGRSVQFAAPPAQPEPGRAPNGWGQQAAEQQQPAQQYGPFALPPGPSDRSAGSGEFELPPPAGQLPPSGQPGRPGLPGPPDGSGGSGEFEHPDAGDPSVPSGAHADASGGQPVPENPDEQSANDRTAGHSVVAASPILGGGPMPERPPAQSGVPAPEEFDAGAYDSGQGPRVRTLGQGVPFTHRLGEQPSPQSYGRGLPVPAPAPAIPSTPSTPAQPSGSGRRRKLATPQQDDTQGQSGGGPASGSGAGNGNGADPRRPAGATRAREFTIGAPESGVAEGPEPLDGPNSPVAVDDGRGRDAAQPSVDDEIPPEPLDNPRRLLVWPEPDVATRHALSERGYRPVLVHSREEVDAQIAAYPAALFVDPLTGPVTRTALQSLRTAAVAAEVPVLVTAGLGHATRETAYGADPAVLLKALAPQDGPQLPPRVLLVEEHEPIAAAMAASLERRGLQVAHAPTDSDAVLVAEQTRPNLVVMDLMQVRRRRAGIIDWLRVNGLLNRTPFVVYTSVDLDPHELPRLGSGETVLFFAERSTADEVQSRIVDLLTKIGAR